MSKAFNQYDVVRVIGFGAHADLVPSKNDERTPRIGDTATIVEIYNDPPGYELECCDGHSDGKTTWLRAFGVDDIQLELCSSAVASSARSDNNK